MDLVAWSVLVLLLLRFAGVSRIFHRVEMIQVSEKFVEAVDRRQKLVFISEMIFAELAGCVPHSLQRGGNRYGLCGQAEGGTGLTDCRRAGAGGRGAGGGGGAARGAAGGRII